MPFYFAFQSRNVKSKVKRSLTFGSKTREKSAKLRGFRFQGSTHKWSDSGGVNQPNNSAVITDEPRRHSIQILNGSHSTSPSLRRVFSPQTEREEKKGPPKPPRLMEKKVFTCENPECGKRETLLGMIAINLKSCPACFTHYCSTKCRISHWPKHKLVCQYGRITSYMKTISEICQHDDEAKGLLSAIASSGYAVKGRGCVMLVFANPAAARLFIAEKTGSTPTYSSLEQLERLGVRTDYKKNLVQLISNYKPEYELVLNVAIVAEKNSSTTTVPKNNEPSVIQQFIVSLEGNEENTSNKLARRRFSL